MALSPGSRVGAYDVVSIIGRGGMGEVYRARDARLGRDVALKVLPDAAESDLDSRARFDREACALAALNHPNIATIYGLEDTPVGRSGAGGVAIVMELVEGQTLADRLMRGPLPFEEAMNIAGQIAAALDAAHQRGIIHRDLKPANVKITPTGIVKVLDFGLAKLLTGSVHEHLTLTITAPLMVLGTAAYMAPEQAQGQAADRRADVWSFGVVLYEMITGERPFRGESLQEILTAVLTADLQWAPVPLTLRTLLRACLERDPAKRLRDIADYRFLVGGSPEAPAAARTSRAAYLSIAGAALAAVLLAFFAGRSLTRNENAPSPPAPIRMVTMLPPGVSVTRGPGYTSSVAVSPDGRTIVIAASDKDGQRLYERSLDRLSATPIPGTERGSSPFFSWDGQWIGFFADGRLKRMPVTGGAAIDVAAAPGFSSGASWGPDDRIVFAYGADSSLHVVSAEGGNVEPLITGGVSGRQPEVLPNGSTVLFEAAGQIHAYDRRTKVVTRLLPGSAPRYANGHLIFSRGTTLLAARLDLADLSTAAAFPVAAHVAAELPGSGGGRHYAIARSGALAYVPAAESYDLVIVSPGAVERTIGAPQRSLENPRFSPDGRYVVVGATRNVEDNADLWLHDLRTGAATRLTTDGGRAAIWGSDGVTITYSHLGERQGIYSTRLDGAGQRTQLLAVDAFHWLVGWTPDRSALLYGVMTEGNQSSIVSYRDKVSQTLIGPGNTWGGRLSRDGRWLAYYVLDAGVFEVYVTRFLERGTRWLVAEGTDPAWAPDGNELYFRSGPRLMAARIDKTAGVKVVESRVALDPFLPPLYDDYDIHPDGRTLVAVRPSNRTQGREVTLVLDWMDESPGAAQ